jgi:hypothetical protein
MVVGTPDEADFLLFVNSPAEVQGEGASQLPLRWSEEERARRLPGYPERYADLFASDTLRTTQREMNSALRNVDEFVRAAEYYVAQGRPVAIADVAFVNGGDLALGARLIESGLAPRLAAFGGWNTAGNTLGTVIAHAVARVAHLKRGGNREALRAHAAHLFLRFLDDYAYQAVARTEAMLIDLPALGIAPMMTELPHDVEAVQARVAERIQEQAGILEKVFRGITLLGVPTPAIAGVAISGIDLPWRRLFEVKMEVDVRFADE